MTPTNNPSSSPTSSPSAKPSISPTYPCFASNAGGSRNPVAPALCFPPGQNQTCALFEAVRDYYAQDCDSNSTCEIGQVWGYPIGSWCVGSVVNMNGLFNGFMSTLPNNITSDLSGWDTSSVTTMKYMFSGQTLFNGNLSLWDVSHVNDMAGMFRDASSFNSDSISNWDTSSVTTMETMFTGASSFNSSSILSWNVTNVVNMAFMFYGATDFAQNLCLWKVAPAVSLGNCGFYGYQQCTGGMFTNSLGQPNLGLVGNGGFDATACN